MEAIVEATNTKPELGVARFVHKRRLTTACRPTLAALARLKPRG